VKTSSSARRATSSRAAVFALLVGCASGGATAVPLGVPPGVSTHALRTPVDFSFDAVGDVPLTAEGTRGSPTVISFITTSSLSSQAQADFLVAMAKHDGDRVHYAVVVLETSENRELVALYKKALSIPFPVAVADAQTLAGASAFGDVTAVPVTVLLDRQGRIVWRMDGRVVRSEEMRSAMRGL
jgi:hypothetical protein